MLARLKECRARFVAVILAVGVAGGGVAEGFGDGLTFEQIAAIRSVAEVIFSPDGTMIAYTLSVPRTPGRDPDGPPWRELHLIALPNGGDRTYVGGDIRVSGIRFTPDGRLLTYLATREGDEHTALWAIPVCGGESLRLLTFDTAIIDYRVSPNGSRVAFIAAEPETEKRTRDREHGYTQEVFEEDWLPTKVWLAAMPPPPPVVRKGSRNGGQPTQPAALPIEGSAFHVRWHPDGSRLAIDVAPRPLIDDSYASRKIQVVDASSGDVLVRFETPGKLGDFEFSPGGAVLAMISAADSEDPAAGRLVVAPAAGGPMRDLLPDLPGHVRSFAWRDPETLVFVSDEGVETRLGQVGLDDVVHVTTYMFSGMLIDGTRSPVLDKLNLPDGGAHAALIGETPSHPPEVYLATLDNLQIERVTTSNPWLSDLELAPQRVFTWKARDGLELEGILVSPRGAADDGPPPLIVAVHGGPESHRRNGWETWYAEPGQVAAALGYAFLYPNYRGSTGRGVAFSKLGQGDAAGREFDDLVDAVDALVARGIVDPDRVGVAGASYGGYAAAWLATRYSDRFRAAVMFVGISNRLTQGLTTDVPLEDLMVHTLVSPLTRWQLDLERSPIHHLDSCRTPLLIAGGTDDRRVDPSQSLQLYRALKLIGKTPVRFVRYPGEGHGNSRAASRDDFCRRLMGWMDHFVKNGGTDLPPRDLEYGASGDAGAGNNEPDPPQVDPRKKS